MEAARELAGSAAGSCSGRFRLLRPGVVVRNEYSLSVLSMCIINGRNYLRMNYRQVQVIIARCLIIVIKKHLEVPGVHF